MSSSATVLASVGICVACANALLIWVFALVFPSTLLGDSTCILSSSSAPVPFRADAVVGTRIEMQVVLDKDRRHVHNHCVLDCLCKRCS